MPADRSLCPALLALLLLLAAGCAGVKTTVPGPEEKPAMERIGVEDYPEFFDDLSFDGLEHGILQSLTYLRKLPPSRTFSFGPDRYDAGHMARSLEHFLDLIRSRPSAAALRSEIVKSYLLYRSTGAPETGRLLFTGYYEPALEGSLRPSDAFRYPVYARPADLVFVELSRFNAKCEAERIAGRLVDQRVVPYWDRSEIESAMGGISGRAKVLAWVKDRVDLFFLHIQGSGIIFLDTGGSLRVHFDGSNGKPYRSIGKYLLEQGKIPAAQMSMQKIREYLRSHPDEVESVLNHNPSYVFFKPEPDGPIGSLDVPLTPLRSVALDGRVYPRAALAFMEAAKPLAEAEGSIRTWVGFSRFILNQDTGGAIRGPGRGDLFFGSGPYAEIAAGHMRHPGNLYFLVLKNASD